MNPRRQDFCRSESATHDRSSFPRDSPAKGKGLLTFASRKGRRVCEAIAAPPSLALPPIPFPSFSPTSIPRFEHAFPRDVYDLTGLLAGRDDGWARSDFRLARGLRLPPFVSRCCYWTAGKGCCLGHAHARISTRRLLVSSEEYWLEDGKGSAGQGI